MADPEPVVVDTGTEELLCEIKQRVATITLNRPEARNSLSDNLTPALRAMVQQMDASKDIGAIIITGAGQAFCSGGNIKEMGGRSEATPQSLKDRINQLKERQRTLTGRIASTSKPTIAVLPGPAAGAGLSIALACDIRIASDTAFVTTAYANVGLSGDYGMSWTLPRLVGRGRANDLLLTARKVTAEESLSMGLFNHVVGADDLRSFAFEYAHKLANGPTAAFAAIKQNLDFADHHDLLESLDNEAENMIKTAQSSDHAEAIEKFIRSRKK
jgi:enoyl-CoA hydratase/carnithine racemase